MRRLPSGGEHSGDRRVEIDDHRPVVPRAQPGVPRSDKQFAGQQVYAARAAGRWLAICLRRLHHVRSLGARYRPRGAARGSVAKRCVALGSGPSRCVCERPGCPAGPHRGDRSNQPIEVRQRPSNLATPKHQPLVCLGERLGDPETPLGTHRRSGGIEGAQQHGHQVLSSERVLPSGYRCC